MLQQANTLRGRLRLLAIGAVVVVALVAIWLAMRSGSHVEATAEVEANDASLPPMFSLSNSEPNTLVASAHTLETHKFETAEVLQSPPPDPLQLPGSLVLDPNRLVRVHARFGGEIVRIGRPAAGPNGTPEDRPLRYGDRVRKGDQLAVVWSKDIGEKKSELIDAISKLVLDKKLLTRLEQVEKGVVPERQLFEARRNVEADVVAEAKAERTLRSWRLTDEELNEVRREARELHEQLNPMADDDVERTWAELNVPAPMDGMIVEKNFNVGDIVDPSQDLFKIASLDPIQVMANVYEEDLPSLKRLPPNEHNWTIEMRSSTNERPIKGTFDVIGAVIDPVQHTGVVQGWLPNPNGRLSAGQFITATVQLPADPAMVAIPTAALIEEGTVGAVFVETSRGHLQRRNVAVTRRGRTLVFVRAEPTPAERRLKLEPLHAGERVITSGGLQLLAELNSLQTGAEP
ncbi:MAG TPA: efflux RND transporter periplasmic adaptor subunit [Pirellulales bacterium]|nr:efflux RND transporter periplasmic adaptor subunit [Pirellulales bacterium]